MRSIFKALLLFSIIALFVVILAILRMIFMFFPNRRRAVAVSATQLFGKIAVFILNIKIRIVGKKELLKNKGVLFVCNHLSYLDGVIITSLSPLVFVGRADLKKWPLLGIFSFLSETIFVNRRYYSNVHNDIKCISSFLSCGINVILFPEGTSSSGNGLLPFKSCFFAAPIEANSTVLPLAIKYKQIDSQSINENNKDSVYWYADMYFFPHLLKVCNLRSIAVDVHVLDPIDSNKLTSQNADIKRKYLCSLLQKEIDKCLFTQ